MKTHKKLFIFAALLGSTWLNTTCEKKLFSKITYQGYVYDSLGGAPVSGVTVYLSACSSKSGQTQCDSYLVGSSVSDASGHFYIHEEAPSSNSYCISLNTQNCAAYYPNHLPTKLYLK